jgi:hypothetical protein
MTVDPRPGWIRQRTFELQQTGMKYDAAHEQAEKEADAKFGAEDNGENGNGGENGGVA